MDFTLQSIDFDIDDVFQAQGSAKIKTTLAKVKRYPQPKTVKYQYAVDLAKDVGVLNEGECTYAIVSGNFISGDFLEAYLFENDLIVDEIIITTLSMSRENVDSLKNIMDFRLNGKMGLIVSDYFFAHERSQGIKDIVEQLGGDGFTLAVAGLHTKITLIKTQCGKHIVISGSSNLRSSLNIEQITIDCNRDLYYFNREWMAVILNSYQATHKMLRRNELWQQVAKGAAL